MALLKRFIRQPSALVGAVFLLLLAALAVLAPWLTDSSPWEMNTQPMLPPFRDAAHWLGSDLLGRDLGSGLLYGARVSLAVGVLASLSTLLVGLIVGAIAGYFGGWLDGVLMRIAEFFQIIPQLVLAVILVAVLEPSLGSIVLAISLVAWPAVARLVRSEFLTLRQREFVQAARVLGQSPLGIISQQILPNALAPLLVEVVYAWPGIGRLLYDALAQRDYGVLMGGFLVISTLVVGFNVLTDVICRLLDPRIGAGGQGG